MAEKNFKMADLFLIEIGGLLQLKVGVGVNIC